MTDDELQKIACFVVDEMKKDEDSFFIERKSHFLDHEMLKSCRENHEAMRLNHDFISSVRQGGGIAKKATVVCAVTAFLGFAGAAFWHYLGESLKKLG